MQTNTRQLNYLYYVNVEFVLTLIYVSITQSLKNSLLSHKILNFQEVIKKSNYTRDTYKVLVKEKLIL